VPDRDVGQPPLGTPVEGRHKEENAVAPGSLLRLYTDGIVEDRATGLDGLPELIDTVERVVSGFTGTCRNRTEAALYVTPCFR
jgi:hypothetical protein